MRVMKHYPKGRVACEPFPRVAVVAGDITPHRARRLRRARRSTIRGVWLRSRKVMLRR